MFTGSASNSATGNLLEGARVEFVALGLIALTDNTGRFLFTVVPAGTHEVAVYYLGLDPVRSEVTIAAGQRAVRNFDLTTGLYVLAQFKVTGEREGAAAAITAQRNAGNVKNIAALDTFGNLPNMSPGEVAIRLPGIAGNLDDEGNIRDLVVRGMSAGLNTTTLDNTIMANAGGQSRTFAMSILTGALFEQIEVTKGHTPDKSASSMGGTVNLKTRSPLSMSEQRRVTYRFAGRLAPSFTEQTPLREPHRFHELLNLGYQEIFSVLGGQRNLGASINLFYSENVAAPFLGTRGFENTTNRPAYIYDYRTQDNYNSRRQASANVRVDYRLSPTTKLTFNSTLGDNNEAAQRRFETRAFTTQAVGTTGTAGILPGYTDRITRVRGAVGSTIDVTGAMYGYFQRLRHVDLGAEHAVGRLEIDANAIYSQAHINTTNGGGAILINRLTGVGWILDRTESDLYPRFIQTEGPDFTNPANYRPISLTTRNNKNQHEVKEIRGNLRYTPPTQMPLSLKTGFSWREQMGQSIAGDRQWNYIGGATSLPSDPSIVTWDSKKTGRRIPQWEPAAFMNDDRTPANAALWREDIYFRESTKYTNTSGATETATGAYVMAQGKLGRTGILTGVRTEKTEMASFGWVRERILSTAAQRTADPVGAARQDYADNWREPKGSYTKSFPSVHLTQDVTSNLKARLSWSTSFGRPAMSTSYPSYSFSDANQTVTTSNPGILPQTAASWDATLEYYFEPVGNLSVGWFNKTIKDYIVNGVVSGTVATGANNGFDGQFGGYTLLSTGNAGTAHVQGWEASYQHQLTFLPGLLKGLSFSANHTWLDTHGDFGGTARLTTGQLAGFIPRTGNVSLSWRYRKFSARALLNYTSDFITSYSAASVGRNVYRLERTILNLGAEYQISPSLRLSCEVTNPTNEPRVSYVGIPDQIQNTNITHTTITFGVSGRF